MVVGEGEIERIAREMIKQHGAGAAMAGVERLNERIDRGDWGGRDVWAQIVHCIHNFQRAENPVFAGHKTWGRETWTSPEQMATRH